MQRDRLSEKTRKGCDSQNSDRKTERKNRRIFPAYTGQKSNRLIDAKVSFYGTYVMINEQVTLQNQDPVLNATAARLGVSLRQTEDQLTSSMLASTASFINCTGGVNGIA